MGNIGTKIYQLEDYLPTIIIKQIKEESISRQEDELEDQYLESLFYEDFAPGVLENISVEKRQLAVKRNQQIVKRLKQVYDCKCQICGERFLMDNGIYYCEAHHIIPISEDGSQMPENVIILCASHHRMFHYAKNRIVIDSIIDGVRKIHIDNVIYHVEYKLS